MFEDKLFRLGLFVLGNIKPKKFKTESFIKSIKSAEANENLKV